MSIDWSTIRGVIRPHFVAFPRARVKLGFCSAVVWACVTAAVAQVGFDQAIKDLTSPDTNTRLKTLRMLKDAAYPEAAVPIAALVSDSQAAVQLEAIAAELAIFQADEAATRKGSTLSIEKRRAMGAGEAFSSGPSVLAFRPVPMEVLNALRAAMHEDHPRVGLEALYAFGTLGYVSAGAARHDLQRVAAPDLAALLGVRDAAERSGAARVIGRLYERRAGDGPIDSSVGDALIGALNDKDRTVKTAALEALGSVRYDRAVQAITELFQFYGKGEPSEAALDALARIASPSSAALFETELTSLCAPCRGIAVEGLARIGDRTALSDIQAALAHERVDSVQLAMAFAATMLSNAPIDRIAEALVVARFHDQAKRYLVEIVPGRGELFARHVQDPDARMRLEIADVFMLAGDPATLPHVEALARDKDAIVAHAARHALARMRLEPPRPTPQ